MAESVVVIDGGTGYTKMGYAGNEAPAYVIPTLYARPGAVPRGASAVVDDLHFEVGDAAAAKVGSGWNVSSPIRHGVVEDWDAMERLLEHCFYRYLRVEPEESGVVLTEAPANPPEKRERMAEIMFETFGVQQLHIAVQGVLALRASWSSDRACALGLGECDTGVVIDSGDGVTHVIPIVNGFVLHHAIQHIPLAGRDITNYILSSLRERREPIPPADALLEAQQLKEQACYIAKDMPREFALYDSDLPKYITQRRGVCRASGKPYTYDVGYERFLGPELFFHPELFSDEWTTPLPEVVDAVIWSCPIDCRRPLYRNIVLSGGSTMFNKLDRRLQKDLRAIVNRRAKRAQQASGDPQREVLFEVNVISHDRQRYAVWHGGSMLGASADFGAVAKTRREYEEHGPSICRNNHMFHSVF